jgi:hypothetical protein
LPAEIIIDPDSFSDRAKSLLNSPTALLCYLCTKTLDGSTRKSSEAPQEKPVTTTPTANSIPTIVVLEDIEASDENHTTAKRKRTHPAPPKKKRDTNLYSYFTIINLDGGRVSVSFNHCSKYNKASVARFNPTHARSHLINVCPGIGAEIKRRLSDGSQSGRRNAEHYAQSVDPTHTLADMRAAAFANAI